MQKFFKLVCYPIFSSPKIWSWASRVTHEHSEIQSLIYIVEIPYNLKWTLFDSCLWQLSDIALENFDEPWVKSLSSSLRPSESCQRSLIKSQRKYSCLDNGSVTTPMCHATSFDLTGVRWLLTALLTPTISFPFKLRDSSLVWAVVTPLLMGLLILSCKSCLSVRIWIEEKEVDSSYYNT